MEYITPAEVAQQRFNDWGFDYSVEIGRHREEVTFVVKKSIMCSCNNDEALLTKEIIEALEAMMVMAGKAGLPLDKFRRFIFGKTEQNPDCKEVSDLYFGAVFGPDSKEIHERDSQDNPKEIWTYAPPKP